MIKKTPLIRFNGFSDNWKEFEIGQVVAEKKRPIMLEDETTYQLVTVKRRNEGVVSRGYLKGKQILVKNYFEVKSGDYIISKRQVVHGANGIVPSSLDGAIVSNEYLVATDNDNITTEFLALLSKLPDMYKKFFVSSYGIDIEKLVFDVDDWKKRKVSVPSTGEQKKIYDFFKDVDKLLSEEQAKYKKLLDTKKALIDKMFPKNNQIKPEVRFKGFSEPWIKVRFADIADVKRGLTYKPTDICKTGVRVLRSSNIDEDTFIICIDDVFVLEQCVQIPLVQQGDILITAANGSNRLVGKHAVVTRNDNEKIVHGGFMLSARTKNPFFLNASMSSSWYKKFITTNIAGGNGAIGNLNRSDLEKQELWVPCIEEQELIGDLFQKIDLKITLQKQKISKLECIKKAYLERIFL